MSYKQVTTLYVGDFSAIIAYGTVSNGEEGYFFLYPSQATDGRISAGEWAKGFSSNINYTIEQATNALKFKSLVSKGYSELEAMQMIFM